MSSELPPDAIGVYKAFEHMIMTMQQESPPGSDRSFIVPAFVKPSHSGNVTYRQCCVIRFWPPCDIPGTTRDLAERMQLRCFPLFPQGLDWRRAMESVAQRNGADGGPTGGGLGLQGSKRGTAGGGRSSGAMPPSEASVQAYCSRKLSAPCGESSRCSTAQSVSYRHASGV